MGLTYSMFGGNGTTLDNKREEIFRRDEEEIIKQTLLSSSHCRKDSECSPENSKEGTLNNQDETDSPENLAMYKYPFENLIFEGGGNKGFAYSGSIKCLEDLNIMPQIKRVGGSSAGAITAALVALGYGSSDIDKFMSENVQKICLDHSFGYLSLLPNLLRGWGWNPGHRLYYWLGEKFSAKTGNPNLTFHELYKLKGIELCIVVTNLNQMRAEYCHPKTTPNMIIREALRMSMSIPVVFMACIYDNHGQMDTYVDGGVLCNYPIQCFDGWYLSMDKKDTFLLQMQKLDEVSQIFSVKNRFQQDNQEPGEVNKKSLGFLVYNDTEVEVMRTRLDKRPGAVKPDKPIRETILYKKKIKAKNVQTGLREERKRCQKAAEAFVKTLQKHNLHDDVHIDKEELRKVLEDEESFRASDREKLFGKNISLDEAFYFLDKDRNGKIDFQELMRFLERRNIGIQTRIQGYQRTEITNLIDFASALQNSWTMNVKYVYVQDEDFTRTVGINTGHVGTSDYVLEKEDQQFLTENLKRPTPKTEFEICRVRRTWRGYNATMAFIKSFIAENAGHLVKKSG